ncbi:MAG: helix-turn-helix transcriptional regulator [Alphaproteobacteria bacterium]|nr:helix-turn-helix transcriptional regulator [Alphaproteobacteria bacterium]
MTHLKYLRKKCGYTLESLADVTSISVSYLSRLESGTRRLNTDLIRRLSHAFNCSAAELLQETIHESNVITPIDFSSRQQRERQKTNVRENLMPLYQLEKSNEDGNVVLTLSIRPTSEWKYRPQELASKNDAFAIKADEYFLPHFNVTSTLYMEPASNLSPESTVIILNRGQVLIKKVWSVTPTSLQLCDIADMDILKKGADLNGKLMELDRSSLEAAYKVVGYSDFNLA